MLKPVGVTTRNVELRGSRVWCLVWMWHRRESTRLVQVQWFRVWGFHAKRARTVAFGSVQGRSKALTQMSSSKALSQNARPTTRDGENNLNPQIPPTILHSNSSIPRALNRNYTRPYPSGSEYQCNTFATLQLLYDIGTYFLWVSHPCQSLHRPSTGLHEPLRMLVTGGGPREAATEHFARVSSLTLRRVLGFVDFWAVQCCGQA